MENGGRLEFTYKKDDNQTLFKRLEENTGFGILKAQNYSFERNFKSYSF